VLIILCVFGFRAGQDELLQKPFQKGRHTKVPHKNVAAHEWDRYCFCPSKYQSI